MVAREGEKLKQLLNIYIINPDHYFVWASMQLALMRIQSSTVSSREEKDFFTSRLMAAINQNK